MVANSHLSHELTQQVAVLLGRRPRGLDAVEVFDCDGMPSVIRVSSLVDNKPFPTLYWLVDKALSYHIDQLEARGIIQQLQNRVDHSEDLKCSMVVDHQCYIAKRERFMSAAVKQRLKKLGYFDALQLRGIGGIADFSRIRCLHTYYAAHLVEKNTIGQLLDEHYL